MARVVRVCVVVTLLSAAIVGASGDSPLTTAVKSRDVAAVRPEPDGAVLGRDLDAGHRAVVRAVEVAGEAQDDGDPGEPVLVARLGGRVGEVDRALALVARGGGDDRRGPGRGERPGDR